MMDEKEQRAAFMSALMTEHFVLQTATSTTHTEAAARSSLYVMALSSSLVATGFIVNASQILLLPFLATTLTAVFFLGIFTVARLVETGLESLHYLEGIARIRAVYRTLGADAAKMFATERGRWPEAESPALKLGPVLASLGTAASMIAGINGVVGGAAIALLAHQSVASLSTFACVAIGLTGALLFAGAFYRYQGWRYREFDKSASAADSDGD